MGGSYNVVIDVELRDGSGGVIQDLRNVRTIATRASSRRFTFDPKPSVDVGNCTGSIESFVVIDPDTGSDIIDQDVRGLDVSGLQRVTLDEIRIPQECSTSVWEIVETGFSLEDFESEL